jgi:hypothetical protein
VDRRPRVGQILMNSLQRQPGFQAGQDRLAVGLALTARPVGDA